MKEYLSELMTHAEVESLLMHIQAEHQVGAQGKWVKYVSPRFDMRTGLCYMVSLTEWGGEETMIHTQNECTALKDNLYKRCMDWLDRADLFNEINQDLIEQSSFENIQHAALSLLKG